jgi:hypothetical protein
MGIHMLQCFLILGGILGLNSPSFRQRIGSFVFCKGVSAMRLNDGIGVLLVLRMEI